MGGRMLGKLLTFEMTRKSVFLICVGLACGAVFWVLALPLLTDPRLSEEQKEWKEFHGDDPQTYPVEVLSHGYRMVQAFRKEPKKADQGPSRPVTLVEWEWKMVIKNRSSRNEQVYVQYLLVDGERLPVDVDYRISPQPVRAWETITIHHRTEMIYEDLRRVANPVWEISWGGSKKKRKGF